MNGKKHYVLLRSKTEIHTYEGGSLRTADIRILMHHYFIQSNQILSQSTYFQGSKLIVSS